MKTKTITEIIKEETLKSKTGKVLMITPDSEVEFNIEYWETLTNKVEQIVLERQSMQLNPLDFITKVN